jgi:hypothetical protein
MKSLQRYLNQQQSDKKEKEKTEYQGIVNEG